MVMANAIPPRRGVQVDPGDIPAPGPEANERKGSPSGSTYPLGDFGGGKVTDRGIKKEGGGWKNR